MSEQRMKTFLLILIAVLFGTLVWVIKLEYQIRDLQCDIKETLVAIRSDSCDADDTRGEVNIIRKELIRKLQTAPYRLDLDSMRREYYDEGNEDREIKELMKKLLLKLQ